MDDFDDAILSFAIREEFPNVIFKSNNRFFDNPDLDGKLTIPESGQSSMKIWFPRDGWEPLFFPHEEYPEKLIVINHPHAYLFYNRTRWIFDGPYSEKKWVFSLPSPEQGNISTGPQEWDEELKAFRSKLTRIMGKLMTNRLKHWEDRDQTILTKNSRRYNTWAGYHVLKWCQGGERRMIDGLYRPCDDWDHKETDWYRSLREKVEKRFGTDYGGPRKFVPRPIEKWPNMTTRRPDQD